MIEDEYNMTNAYQAGENAAGELVQACVDILKVCPKPWQSMSEADQGEFLEAIKARVSHVLTRVVFDIAGNGFQSLTAAVDKVVFKDGVQATLSIPPGAEGRHELADREGDVVVVVLASPEMFAGGTDGITPDPDQPGLPLGAEYTDQDGDGMEGGIDPLYEQAREYVSASAFASISRLQRHFKVGFNRAARLIESLEAAGVVSLPDETGGREVLIKEKN